MQTLLQNLLYFLIRTLSFTYRFHFVNQNDLPKNHILAVWHNNIFAAITSQIGNPHVVMVSKSKDAELVARSLVKMGHQVVRGSAMRGGVDKGGKKAKDEMKKFIEKNIPGAIAVDGPMGPVYQVKAGVTHLAFEMGIPIIPYIPLAEKYWTFNSWDKFKLPKPFSRINIYYGKAIHISDKHYLEEARELLRNELFRGEDVLRNSASTRR